MAPSVTLDTSPDFDFSGTAATASRDRTLLLAPPSLSAHPEALNGVLEAHDRNATDIQMLDRLALGLVSLPAATYDVVMLLTDVDAAARETARLLDRNAMERIAQALKVNGRLLAQDNELDGTVKTEAVLAGLVEVKHCGMLKPDSAAAGQTVSLSFGKRKVKANAAAVPANGIEAVNTAKRKSEDISTTNGGSASSGVLRSTPAGIGFVDVHDDMDAELDDDEMEIPSNEELAQAGGVDPDTLLTKEDLEKPIDIRKWTPSVVSGGRTLMSCQQPKRVNPTASVDERAKTARAAWPSGLKQRTMPNAQMQTPTWPSFERTSSVKSISQSRVRSGHAGTARWATHSGVMGVHILDCLPSSQVRKSAC